MTANQSQPPHFLNSVTINVSDRLKLRFHHEPEGIVMDQPAEPAAEKSLGKIAFGHHRDDWDYLMDFQKKEWDEKGNAVRDELERRAEPFSRGRCAICGSDMWSNQESFCDVKVGDGTLRHVTCHLRDRAERAMAIVPMTVEEADVAFDAAEPIPFKEGEIDRIVEQVTRMTARGMKDVDDLYDYDPIDELIVKAARLKPEPVCRDSQGDVLNVGDKVQCVTGYTTPSNVTITAGNIGEISQLSSGEPFVNFADCGDCFPSNIFKRVDSIKCRDCDGNELKVGDVVECVEGHKQGPTINHKYTITRASCDGVHINIPNSTVRWLGYRFRRVDPLVPWSSVEDAQINGYFRRKETQTAKWSRCVGGCAGGLEFGEGEITWNELFYEWVWSDSPSGICWSPCGKAVRDDAWRMSDLRNEAGI